MKDLQFPLNFKFKIGTLANDFVASDASGAAVAYVRQKMFKLKEDILIYSNESKSDTLFRIKADRWLDFSAAYNFTDRDGKEMGKIVRKGWRSIWKTSYELVDQHQNIQYHVNEENAWVKVWDSLLGEVPLLGMFTGYFFNPAYLVTDLQGNVVAKIKKQASFFGRHFEVSKLQDIDQDDQERIMLGLMMMILLERRKG